MYSYGCTFMWVNCTCLAPSSGRTVKDFAVKCGYFWKARTVYYNFSVTFPRRTSNNGVIKGDLESGNMERAIKNCQKMTFLTGLFG